MTALFEENIDVHDPVEVHWSANTILAIFFAASLVSAVFFGLGYSFGGTGTLKRSLSINSAPTNDGAAESPVLPAQANSANVLNKPSPIAQVAENVGPRPSENAPSTPPIASRSVAAMSIAHPAPPIADKKIMPAPAAPHESSTIDTKTSGRIMVQVGAIGNRKDAERLVAALRRKGFRAGIYPEKHDKFLHVQIGPFQDASQAQSKRHQVMASGFHAILKNAS
ncbi:MAG: SPOR domain-containing protein [Acidobacteriaceae bacterium]